MPKLPWNLERIESSLDKIITDRILIIESFSRCMDLLNADFPFNQNALKGKHALVVWSK